MRPFIYATISIILFVAIFFSCETKSHVNLSEIPTNTALDTILTDLLELAHSNPDSANLLIRKYLNDESYLADSTLYYSLVKYYAGLKYNSGEIDSCKFFMQKALKYWENQETKTGRSNCCAILSNLSFIYSIEGKTDSSLFYHERVIEIALKYDFNDIAIASLLSKTHLLSKVDNYGGAIETVEKAIRIAGDEKDSVNLISCIQAYADLYVNCHFFEEAAIQYEEVLKYKDYFKPYSLFCHFNGKGRMYYLQSKYDDAKNEFLNAHKQWNSIDKIDKIIVSNNLAEVYLYCQQPDSAKLYLDYLKSEFESFRNIPDFEFNYYSLLGEYYKNVGNNDEARKAFLRADAIKSENKLDTVIDKLHLQRSAGFYSSIGQFKKAYSKFKEYEKLSENILEENNRKQISAIKYRYQRDTTLLQQQKTILSQEIKVDRLADRQKLIITVVGFIFISIVGSFIWWRNYERKKHEVQSLMHSRDVALLRMESARNRISPHFMFNVLNSVIHNKKSMTNVEENLRAFVRLLQSNLSNIDSVGVALSQELRFVKDYVLLDNLRFELNIDYTEEIDKNVNAEMIIPSMCLHILVENAIKHGLKPKQNDKKLTIRAQLLESKIILSVIDNGVGRSLLKPGLGTGTGIKVLNRFISIINQNNTEKIEFRFIDLFDENKFGIGTIAELKIPLIIDYKI